MAAIKRKVQAALDKGLKLAPDQFLGDGELPVFCEELLNLPHGLRHIQNFIFGRMKYPSRATAGITAIAALGAYAMPFLTVESYSGLGLNEYFMVLAPTGFGKEDMRQAIKTLYRESNLYSDEDAELTGNLKHLKLPSIQYSATASPQALHRILEASPNQLFMSDEFGEWLAQSKTSSHNQAALAYMMEIYTSALGTVTAPQSVQGNYTPVNNPRVTLFTTSSAERMSEVMTKSHADSGAYNRVVIFVAEQTRIPKKYDGLVFDPPREAIMPFNWVLKQDAKTITFSKEAWQFFTSHDSVVIEPLKFADHGLAGRLSEQAIKMAGVIALSDKRTVINMDDMKVAFRIRENLYHRAKAALEGLGGLSNEHGTTKALAQLRDVFSKHQHLPRSRISGYSRAFAKLSVREQHEVIRALADEGTVRVEDKGRVVSLIYESVS